MATVVGATTARERISAALDAIDAAHDVLRSTPSDLVGNDFRVDIAERLETQERTNRGLMYRIFGELADPPDGEGSIAAVRAGLGKRLRITPREITRRCRLAARIRPRHSLTGAAIAPELPELATAVEAGTIGEDHIRAVCQTVDVLPASVAPAQVAEAEAALVSHAARVDAGVLTKIAQRIADHLNPDGLFSDADRARRRGLTLSRQGPDGMSKLSGLLDPQARAHFEAVAAAVRPGRHQPDGHDGAGRDERTPAQRRHDAFTLAMATAISSGKLGTHRGHPVTVVVTTTLAELNQAAHAARDSSIPLPPPALTGGGSRLPMRDLIAMAAGAIHYLAVFDHHTKRPLYLGRQKRLAPPTNASSATPATVDAQDPTAWNPATTAKCTIPAPGPTAGTPTPTNCSSPAVLTTPTPPRAANTPPSPQPAASPGPTAPDHPKSTTRITPKNSSKATPTHPRIKPVGARLSSAQRRG